MSDRLARPLRQRPAPLSEGVSRLRSSGLAVGRAVQRHLRVAGLALLLLAPGRVSAMAETHSRSGPRSRCLQHPPVHKLGCSEPRGVEPPFTCPQSPNSTPTCLKPAGDGF